MRTRDGPRIAVNKTENELTRFFVLGSRTAQGTRLTLDRGGRRRAWARAVWLAFCFSLLLVLPGHVPGRETERINHQIQQHVNQESIGPFTNVS